MRTAGLRVAFKDAGGTLEQEISKVRLKIDNLFDEIDDLVQSKQT
jgi:hypothetical protein